MNVTRRALLGGALAMAACRRRTRDERGRIIVHLWYSLGGRNREVLLDIVNRFHASQDDVRVEAVYQGDYYESLAKLRTAIAAGAAPALSHVVAEVVPYLDRAKAIEPLDGYPGLLDIPFVKPLGQTGAFEGGGDRPLVCVPLNRSTPLMYCNGALFEKAGLAPPKTWQELVSHARALTVPGTRYGYQVPISWWFWVAHRGAGGGEAYCPISGVRRAFDR